MRLLLINFLSLLIILTATFIFFSYSTIYILLSFIVLILLLSALLLALGAEFFAIVYTLVYIGVILVFFLFVILLIDLRLEIKNVEQSSIVFASPENIFFSILFFTLLSIGLDIVVCQEFSHLEELSILRPEHQSSYWVALLLNEIHISTVGFFLFHRFGFIAAATGLLMFFSLLGALYIIKLANRELDSKHEDFHLTSLSDD